MLSMHARMLVMGFEVMIVENASVCGSIIGRLNGSQFGICMLIIMKDNCHSADTYPLT